MNACPHCGAAQTGREFANEFSCKSYIASDGRVCMSRKCSHRHLLFLELQDAKARIAELEMALLPFAQIGDIANDPDCTLWKRAVSAGSVRLARGVLKSKENAK